MLNKIGTPAHKSCSKHFSASYETLSCEEQDAFCGDCLPKSEAATRRLIKASGGVKVSSVCKMIKVSPLFG